MYADIAKKLGEYKSLAETQDTSNGIKKDKPGF